MTGDYLMRQIEDMTRALAGVLFMRNFDKHDIFDEEGQFSPENFLSYRLHHLILQGQINDAENLLFHTIERDPQIGYLAAALDFYETLAVLPDAELLKNNFSRAEVADELSQIQKIYGFSSDILPAGGYFSETP